MRAVDTHWPSTDPLKEVVPSGYAIALGHDTL